jgi:hypothetical protein
MLAIGRIYYREVLSTQHAIREGGKSYTPPPRSLPPWSLPSPSVEILHLFGKGFSIPS